METVLGRCFVPNVMLAASPDCESLYNDPLLTSKRPVASADGRAIRLQPLPQIAENTAHLRFSKEPEVEQLIRELHKASGGQDDDLFNKVLERLVVETTVGDRAQAFETWGHPLACILVVSSANANPISALTQLYQQSYTDCPASMSADFLRCVLYVDLSNEGRSDPSSEDFETVLSQFGPYCYNINGFESLESGLATVTTESVYPYLHNLMVAWHAAGTSKRSNTFGFGKLLKKLVNSGPPRPDNNVFADVCREMQPHVASIPAKKRDLDLDMQIRRLADVAFTLRDYKLAGSAYESLRKPFSAEQKWPALGAVNEMAAVTEVILGHSNSDISQAVDTALYTYNSRVHLRAHSLRCSLLTAFCLIEVGDQLLAADLLSSALLDIDPLLGTGSEPAETAMLMGEMSAAYGKRGWQRKVKLWNKLAQDEWARVSAVNDNDA